MKTLPHFIKSQLIILIAIFVLFILSFSISIGSFDFTQDKIYSLDAQTKRNLKSINKPIEIEFYHSISAANQNPQIRAKARLISARLSQIAKLNPQFIHFKFIDTRASSAQENDALKAGLIPYSDEQSVLEPIFIGAVVKGANNNAIIPRFNINSPNFDYEIVKALYDAQKSQKKNITLLNGQDWFLIAAQNNLPMQPIAKIAKNLVRDYNVINLDHEFTDIPTNSDLLLIIQPWALNPTQQNAIINYAQKGGKIILCLDAYSNVSIDNNIGIKSMDMANAQFLQKLGIIFSNQIILDRKNALPVKTQVEGRELIAPQPMYFNLVSNEFAALNNLMGGVNFATASYFEIPNDSLFRNTLATSSDSMRNSRDEIARNIEPQTILNLWQSENTSFPIMIQKSDAHNNGQIIAIADSDFLADSIYDIENSQIGANDKFFANILDNIFGETQFIQLRNKTNRLRQLDKIEALKDQNQEKILIEQAQLKGTLSQLYSNLESANETGANASQKDAIKQEIIATSNQLKLAQNNVRNSIEGAKSIILFCCGIFVPFLILIIGAIIYIRRNNGIRQFNGT
jgi:ABC-type uncharacterized transport system involved in gliding motility auxiliary subunit